MTRSRPRVSVRPEGLVLALVPLAVLNLARGGATPREVVIACMAASLLALTPWLKLSADIDWYRDLHLLRRERDLLFTLALLAPGGVSWATGSVLATVLSSVVLTAAAILRLEHIRRALGPPADTSPASARIGRALRRRRRAAERTVRFWRRLTAVTTRCRRTPRTGPPAARGRPG